jgi:glycosyltransferase involved in cell wall biosynthesis
VFLEAAASGLPSIAGRSGGSHEAVVDRETGMVINPNDVMLLAQSIERLLVDGALRDRMGVAARAWAVRCSYDARVELLAPVAAGDLGVLAPL